MIDTSNLHVKDGVDEGTITSLYIFLLWAILLWKNGKKTLETATGIFSQERLRRVAALILYESLVISVTEYSWTRPRKISLLVVIVKLGNDAPLKLQPSQYVGNSNC